VLILAGLVVAAVLGGKTNLLTKTPFLKAPAVLEQKAQDVIQSLGYTEPPTDRAYGYSYAEEYHRYAEKQEKLATYRAQLAKGQPPLIYFWYRQSPQYLDAGLNLDEAFAAASAVSPNNPPPTHSGMIGLNLDPQGRLMEFSAVPPPVEETRVPPRGALRYAPGRIHGLCGSSWCASRQLRHGAVKRTGAPWQSSGRDGRCRLGTAHSRSRRRFVEKHRLKASPSKAVIGGQCLSQAALLYNNEGEAIGQTPVLAVQGTVQLIAVSTRSALNGMTNMCVAVTSVVPRRRDEPCSRVRECIHPFPENSLRGQYARLRASQIATPCQSPPMVLVTSA